jgi:hypothetical protein
MKNDNTILSLSQNSKKVSVELPWDASITDLIQSFYSSLIGITFFPEQIEQGFIEFLEEKEYTVLKKVDESEKNETLLCQNCKKQLEDVYSNEELEDVDDEEEFICAETSKHIDPFVLSIANKINKK